MTHIASAANVTDMSSESFAQYGKEDAYWVISVSCDNDNQKRTIQRKTDSEQWCPKGNTALCSTDKQVVAKNACGNEYTTQNKLLAAEKAKKIAAKKRQQQLAAQQREAAEKAAAEAAIQKAEQELKERIVLEERMIEIEQKRLELLQRELEVDRRIVEIDDLIKQADSAAAASETAN